MKALFKVTATGLQRARRADATHHACKFNLRSTIQIGRYLIIVSRLVGAFMVINTERGHLTVIDRASMIYFVVNLIFQTHLTKEKCCAVATTPKTYEKSDSSER